MFVIIQIPLGSHCLYSYILKFVTLNVLKYLLQLQMNCLKKEKKNLQ